MPPFNKNSKSLGLGSLLFGISVAVNAQDPQLIPEPAPSPEPSSSPERTRTRQPSSFYASGGATSNSAFVHDQAAAFWGVEPFEAFLENPLQWGPFQFRPFSSYRFTYGNGLNNTPGNSVTTTLHEISPGAVLQSRHLSFRYSPTLKYYSDKAFDDTVDHSASANASFGVGDWTFNLGHSFSDTATPLIETGEQTPRQSHNTVVAAHFQYTDKTSFDFSLTQAIQDGDSLNSSTSWSSMNWVNYHRSETFLVGLGIGGGYTVQDFGTDMTHEQLQGRFGWNPGKKLTMSVNAGAEFRQFVDAALDDQVNPIFGGSIDYSPWEATTLSLSANQSTGSSILDAQVTETIGISAGLRQRFLERLHLDIFAGLSEQEYKGVDSQDSEELQTDRSDEVLSFSIGLGYTAFDKVDISIFYQHSENDSSDAGYTYDSDQYGFQVSYSF